MAPRWLTAWWPKMSRGAGRSGSEHGSTLTSSVVALGADHPHGGRGGDGGGPGSWRSILNAHRTGPPGGS